MATKKSKSTDEPESENGQIRRVKISELLPDRSNANLHTERGTYMVGKSLEKLGAGRSVLLDKNKEIIAGNLTVEQAAAMGLEEVLIVKTDGRQLVAVQRTDMDLDEPETGAREMAYADNRAAIVSIDFDPDQVKLDFDTGVSLGDWWQDFELEELGVIESPDKYSRNIQAPIYTPRGDKPELGQLVDATRTNELVAQIESSDLEEEEKRFLAIAAQRHTVLNFQAIADYYAHSDKATQELMEDSALVIIDFKRAIELGYVRLSEQVASQYQEDNGDA